LLITDDTGASFQSVKLADEQSNAEVPQVTRGFDSSELYACVTWSKIPEAGGLYHSTDFGSSWMKMKSPFSLWSVLADRSVKGRLWAGQYEKFDPAYPASGILSVGGYDGQWQPYGRNLTCKLNWMLRFAPDDRTMLLASENGLYKSVLASNNR